MATIDGDGSDNNLGDTPGNDTLNGNGGNDTLTVTAGADNANGGDGTDTLVIDYAGVTGAVTTGSGPNPNATLGGFDGYYNDGSQAHQVVYSSIENFHITTGSGNDNITTASGDDIVNLGDGDDIADVGSGNDRADGGIGVDGLSADFSLRGSGVSIDLQAGTSTGNAFTHFEYFGTITGTAFADNFVTTNVARNDTLNLGDGNDSATVVAGADTVNGGLGTDTLTVDYSAVTAGILTGSAPAANGSLGGFNGYYNDGSLAHQILYNSIENFHITTGSGNDSITTASGDDIVNLGDGDDLVDVGSGNDQADGGTGVDGLSADLSLRNAGVGINLQTGTSPGNAFVNFEYFGTITGTAYADNFVTSNVARNEILNLGDGDDSATVVNGNDTVNGGLGTDTLTVDYSSVAAGIATVGAPNANSQLGGFNGVYNDGSQAHQIVYNSIENFHITTGSGSDNIVTASGDDIVNLGDGDDLVDVGSGDDQADGGIGVDGLSADLSLRGAGVSIDLQTGTSPGNAFVNFEYFGTITGTAFADNFVTTNAARSETLNLGDGDDSATVLAGADTVNGGLGTDLLIVDYSAVTAGILTGGPPAANGSLGGFNGYYNDGSLAHQVLYSSIETFWITTGSGNDSITTASGNDIVRTGSGNDSVDAAAGNDLVEGGDGNDILNGGADTDTASYEHAAAGVTVSLASQGAQQNTVGAGLDTLSNFENLTGSAHDDTLTGDANANVIDGGAGTDTMTGGDGSDIYYADSTSDVVVEAANQGTDLVNSSAASYTLAANVENLTGLLDTGQSLIGNSDANLITAGGGNDFLDGKAGDDTMIGGLGDDTYNVDSLADVVVEQANQGTDLINTALASYSLATLANVENLTGTNAAGQSLTGNGGANVIIGNSGNDTIDGGAGADSMFGNGGNDTYFVDDGGDVVTENASSGTDEVRTTLAAYTLTANVENLTGLSSTGQSLTGNNLANIIIGGTGNDTLTGGGGADSLRGGQGDDIYIFSINAATIVENAGEGTDEVRTSLGSTTLATNVENLTGLLDTGQILNGNSGGNVITAGAGADTLNDGGGSGADTLTGGAGDDTYVVSSTGGDTIVENSNEGTDTVRTSLASYTLGANLENLVGLTAADHVLTGNGLANSITGNSGNDTLDGGAGNDTLIGGSGNDTYYVDSSADSITENASEGTDLVNSTAAAYALGANVENLTGLLNTGQTLVGNAGANIITAGSGADTLNDGGGSGSDTLIGGDGSDVYIVNSSGTDTITETVAGGTDDEVQTGLASYTLAANVENLIGTGFGQTLTGNGSANIIIGTAGADTIDGGTGADFMSGGAGNDVYYVDDAGDSIGEISGTDEVRTSLASYALAAGLENLTGTGSGQTLTGNTAANVITGTAGADTLNDGGGTGSDTLIGGDGNDTYVVNSSGTDTITDTSGIDEVRTSLASYTLGAGLEYLAGTGNGQTLTGNGLANFITGTLGNDTIDGGTGADDLRGGAGNDIYYVDDAGDSITDTSGTDEVRTSLASYTLTAGLENLTGTGSGQTLTGNGSANLITGTAGADTIDGGTGADDMRGGGGNDIYYVDNVGDSITDTSGTDEVRTSLASYTLAAGLENLTGTGSGQTLTGNSDSNIIIGTAGVDTIDGGTGADDLRGGDGNDIYYVDDAGDSITELAGGGTDDKVYTTVASFQLPDNVEELIYTGAGGAADLAGNSGDNTITGANGSDYFDLSQGGNDTVSGGDGNDGFYFGGAFTAADHVDGGAGTNDQIGLEGDYSAGLVLGANTITGVEVIAVLPGHDYSITTDDGNVQTGEVLTIYGTTLGAGDDLFFDGSAETSGAFRVYGGQGTDILIGGAGDDGFYFGPGRFTPGVDHVDGGAGTNDQLALDGHYGSVGTPFVLSGNDISNVEVVVLLPGPTGDQGTFNVTTDDSLVANNGSMTIYAVEVTTDIVFDGSNELDGAFKIYGGSGNDNFTGGDGNDWIFGGYGADTLTGGSGADTYFYDDAAQSTSTGYDKILGFDENVDKIDVPFTVTGLTSASGNLSTASFDGDLATAFSGLTSHQGGFFTATGGDLNGHTFLVIDANGVAGYQAGADYVIEIVTPATPVDNPAFFM